MRKAGIFLFVVSVAIWGVWFAWDHTRSWCPVDIPYPVAEGSTTTRDFSVNLTGRYEVGIEGKGNNAVPLKDLVCLLGSEPLWPEKFCSKAAVLRTSWVVENNGETVANGKSDDSKGSWTAEGWSQAGRTIGEFNARRGQSFRLRTVTLQDASALSPTHPRLTVVLGGTQNESAVIVAQLLSVVCFATGILGVTLFGLSFSKKPVAI